MAAAWPDDRKEGVPVSNTGGLFCSQPGACPEGLLPGPDTPELVGPRRVAAWVVSEALVSGGPRPWRVAA
jgi:hypothetical protein